VLYYLAGLTCTEAHFSQKATVGLKKASELGLAMVFPDTSQKEVAIDGDRESYDFGIGAGFYLNASQEKWSKNFNMFNHIINELIPTVNKNFPVNEVTISELTFSGQTRNNWSFNGRTWSTHIILEKSRQVQECLSICTNL
jgi:S-formylglutathione hydrolase